MHTKDNPSENKRRFDKIICEIRKNSEKGLEEFYKTYSKFIFITAKNICKADDIANEVVNKVLLKVYFAVKNNLTIESPIAWISVVTKNCTLDSLKGKQYVQINENISAGKNSIETLLDEISFCEYIEPLTEDEKEILTKRFVGLFTFKEIADEDKKPTSTITSIYYRALEKVRKHLEKNKNYE